MDPDGWEELYRRYRQMIEHRATGAGLGRADAEDVVQAVFTAIARTPPGPSRRPGEFRAWICEQTRWRIIDKLREVHRVPIPADAPAGADPEQSPIGRVPAADEFSRQWNEELARHVREVALRRIAAEITPEHLQIYQLTEEQGWPIRRVAAQFHVASATVYVIRHRVGARLREIAATILAELDEQELASAASTSPGSW